MTDPRTAEPNMAAVKLDHRQKKGIYVQLTEERREKVDLCKTFCSCIKYLLPSNMISAGTIQTKSRGMTPQTAAVRSDPR